MWHTRCPCFTRHLNSLYSLSRWRWGWRRRRKGPLRPHRHWQLQRGVRWAARQARQRWQSLGRKFVHNCWPLIVEELSRKLAGVCQMSRCFLCNLLAAVAFNCQGHDQHVVGHDPCELMSPGLARPKMIQQPFPVSRPIYEI